MTTKEALNMFGIKEGETVYAKPIKQLMATAIDQKKVWSLTSGMKADLDKEIEAYKALLKIAK